MWMFWLQSNSTEQSRETSKLENHIIGIYNHIDFERIRSALAGLSDGDAEKRGRSNYDPFSR